MKNIIFVFLLLIMCSCNNREYFNNKIVDELAEIDSLIPSPYGNLIVFVQVENEQIGKLTLNILLGIHRSFYSDSYKSLNGFLHRALNQNIEFKPDIVEQRNGTVFLLNKSISNNYKMNGIDYLINQFCVKHDDLYEIEAKSLNQDELFSIMYYFFLNNFSIIEDEYSGTYFVKTFKLYNFT